MNRNDSYRLVADTSNEIIRNHRITALPVDPMALARSIGIEVQSNPIHMSGVSGMLLRAGEQYGIIYATHIESHGFQRFSVAHELGHYFLPGHIEAVLKDGNMHQSHAGFVSDDRYELEADLFAAALLMPSFLFTEAMRTAGMGLDAIVFLADLCETSRTATAIRYIQCTRDPVALVVSVGTHVDYCFMSDALRDFEGLNWIRKGEPLPKRTASYEFNQDRTRIRAADHVKDSSDLQDWFGGRHSIEVTEEVLGLGTYGKTLTVLTALDLPEPEEIEEEDELIDSWQPKLRR